MNNTLPNLEEKGFINKIKQFFKNLFFKNKFNKLENQEENVEKAVNKKYNTEFKTDIKVDIDNKRLIQEHERNEFFTKIRNNPELLQDLSNERLEMLSNFYEKKIEINNKIIQEKQEKIKKLKKQVNTYPST